MNSIHALLGVAAFGKAKDVTVFAPTNEAFDRTDPDWRALVAPGTEFDGPGVHMRQTLIKQAGLAGIHPPAEFAGKLQNVRSLDGRVFEMDGRIPGAITISAGPAIETGIGFASPTTRTAKVDFPAIPRPTA